MRHEGAQRREQRHGAALEAAWGTDTEKRTHYQPEVQSTRMHQEPLANVVVAPQVNAGHPTRFIEMGARTFKPLAALPQEPFPPWAANPSSVTVHSVTRVSGVLPLAAAAIRFGDVTPHTNRFQIHHHPITVIALVSHDFFDLAVGDHALDLFGGLDERIDTRRCVALSRVRVRRSESLDTLHDMVAAGASKPRLLSYEPLVDESIGSILFVGRRAAPAT